MTLNSGMRDKISYLIMVGSTDEYDGTITRNIERPSRADLPKESLGGVGPDKEEDVIGET
jgi:hypothetical protein